MVILIVVWLALSVALIWFGRGVTAGVPLAYFVGLSLIHIPGVIFHLDADGSDWTRLGFEQTIVGLVTFVAVVCFGKVFTRLRHVAPPRVQSEPLHSLAPSKLFLLNRIALFYCFAGLFSYLVLIPFAGIIPSATAVLSSLGSLVVLGCCLRIWAAQQSKSTFAFWSTIAILPALPLITVVQGGFIGFGIFWLITIVCFIFSQSKRQLLYLLLTPLFVWVGISIFVNYMGARKELRQLVWYQQADIETRLGRIGQIFENFRWLDTENPDHRWAIDGRLNQNVLVGAAVARLESGMQPYAMGGTISDIIVGLVPRALWPDKPEIGGGRDVVTKYTGMVFSAGTSVGAGQVLEFYVNFGTLGVVGGFALLGLLLGYTDLLILESLRQGDLRRFVLWFMFSVSLLQPGGNLVEIVVSAIGAIICALGFNYSFGRRLPSSFFKSEVLRGRNV